MSEDRVQMIHTFAKLWNGGDRGVEGFREFFDPAIELESPLSSVVGEPYRGYAGMERWVRDLEEQFAEWSMALDDARQIAEHVIAIGAVKARGRASDVTLEFPAATVFDFGDNDRITRVHIYLNVEEALKAVGLED